MYYISDKRGDKVGIKDTKDGVVEYYTKAEALSILNQGVTIWGITFSGINQYKFSVLTDTLAQLIQCESGTPLRIKLSKNTDFKQVIYAGSNDGRCTFFDGSGFTGYFELSYEFVKNHEGTVLLDFDNNDAVQVASLLKKMRG